LQELYQVEVEFLAGSGGVFELTKGGQLLFSKKALGRFPTDEELQDLNLVQDL
jgi:selT/selW/selH-like putative selenoprotein